MNHVDLRWDPYFLKSQDENYIFWKELLNSGQHDILYILGRGFDPRMCQGLEMILDAGGVGIRNCLLIEFDEGVDSPSTRYQPQVEENMNMLSKMLAGKGKILSKSINMWAEDGHQRRRVGSRSAAGIFSDSKPIKDYTDVIIDVSAMPGGIYFSLIGKVLYLLEEAKRKDEKQLPNLFIVIAENARLDQYIQDSGIDDFANYVYGFGGDLEMESTMLIPRIWIPILGEKKHNQLERIYTLVAPDEICPVMPSPSQNPRRSDDLIIDYHGLLFDQWRVELKNIIYASERNPFETYRQITKAVLHYNQALKPLGGCKAIVSAVSSKLLSIGALLAAWELKRAGVSTGIASVEAQGYDMLVPKNSEEIAKAGELFTLWLTGDCYER